MLWKRATPLGGFLGLLIGTLSSVGMFLSMKFAPSTIAIFALSPHAKGLAQDMYQALWSCVTCIVVTVLVSLATQPKPDAELEGLVYSLTPRPKEEHVAWYGRPFFWGMASLVLLVILQWRFW